MQTMRRLFVGFKIQFQTEVERVYIYIYRVSHFNLWTRISFKLRYLQKNGLDKN